MMYVVAVIGGLWCAVLLYIAVLLTLVVWEDRRERQKPLAEREAEEIINLCGGW